MDARTRGAYMLKQIQQSQQPQQSEESSSLLQNDSNTHPASQQQPQKPAEEYISDTTNYIKTVKDFSNKEQDWTSQRESEIEKMRDIKGRADKLFSCFNIKNLKKELEDVLTDTRTGLEELQPFLDAVERLAVTTPFMFRDESFPLSGESAEVVRSVISAKIASPLLIHFKRDDEVFFSPKLDNMEILVHQLTKYVCIIKWICKEMTSKIILQVTDTQAQVDPSQLSLSTSLSTKNVPDLIELSRIRMEESSRLTLLVNGQEFTEMYNECHSKMSKLLSSLENNAVGLDRMKDQYSVLTIISSVFGIVGAILSFRGLHISSMTFTQMGGFLGYLSGVFYLVTAVIDFSLNKYYVKKANNNINNFTNHRQNTVDCLKLAASHHHAAPQLDEGNMELGVMKLMSRIRAMSKYFDAFIDGVAVLKRVEISKLNRWTFIGGNAGALVTDLFVLCKEFWRIFTGKKSKAAQLLRSNTDLWCSEIKAWKRIHDCLFKGKQVFRERMDIVETE